MIPKKQPVPILNTNIRVPKNLLPSQKIKMFIPKTAKFGIFGIFRPNIGPTGPFDTMPD